jgi:hypothetical protein
VYACLLATKTKEQLLHARDSVAPKPGGLFVLIGNVQLFYIDLQTGSFEPIRLMTLGQSAHRELNIRTIILLNANASHVVPASVPWVNLASDGEVGSTTPRGATHNATTTPSVPPNASKRVSNSNTGLRNAALPNKYLLACTDRGLYLYEVPGYAMCFFYESAIPPIAARVASFKGKACAMIALTHAASPHLTTPCVDVDIDGDVVPGDNCVLFFNASGDLEVLTLCDLAPLYEIRGALQRFGIRFSYVTPPRPPPPKERRN